MMDAAPLTAEWFQDDDFWTAFRPLAFGAERWNRAQRDVADIVALIGREDRPLRILDLCCGPGRYTLELARLGFPVTAVDLSAAYLSELQRRKDDGPGGENIEIIRDDMRSFRRPEAFEAVICVGLSFGYLADASEDARVISNVYDSLTAGGRFVLEVPSQTWPEELGPWYVAAAEGSEALIEQDVTPDSSRVSSRWHFRLGDAVRTFPFSQRLFSASELEAALRDAGFQNIRAFGGYDGSPVVDGARRIIATATKPGG